MTLSRICVFWGYCTGLYV